MIRSPSLRLLPLSLALLTAVSSCTRKTEGGLVLKLDVQPGVRADCLVVDASSGGARLSRSILPREAMKTEYFIGVSRGDFPATMTWQASAFQGRCADETTWKLSSRSASKDQPFPETGVTQFDLSIGPPDATLDGDRDTFVDAQKGGTDCNDADALVNPSANQACASSIDTNCNGKLYCEDPTCASNTACTSQANGLGFETMLATLQAQDCSAEVAVQSLSNGLPSPVGADTTVMLVASGGSATGLQVFSDTNCTTPLMGNTLPLRFGAQRTTFSFRAVSSGMLTLTASSPGLGIATLNTTILDRPVDRLALNPSSVTARAGACSSAIEVIAQDAQLRPTNSPSGLPLTISFLPAGTTSVSTFTDSACMIPGTPSIGPGTSQTQFFVRGTATTGATPITIQVSTATVNNGVPVTADLTITPADANRIVFTNSVLGVANTTCGSTALELQLQDANGNVATAGGAGVPVALTFVAPGTGGTLSFFAMAGCAGSPVTSLTIPTGSSTGQVWVQAMGAGAYEVRATASSLPNMTATIPVSVSTMPPSALVFPTPSVTVQAGAGICSPAVRVQTRESNSLSAAVSPVVSAVTLTISTSPAGAALLYRDSTCATALTSGSMVTLPQGASEQTFYFRSNTAGPFNLSVSAPGGSNLSTTSPQQSARVVPGPTTQLVATPLTISALAGTCSPRVSLSTLDAFSNPTTASGVVTLSSNPALAPPPAGVAFSAAPDCSAPGPTAQLVDGGAIFYATAQRAQVYSLSATTGSAASVAPVLFTVDAGAPSTLVVTTQPMSSLSAGGCTAVTVERRDAFMNPAPGAVDAFTVNVDTADILSVHNDVASCMAGTALPLVGFTAGQTRATFVVRGRRLGTSTLTVTSSTSAASATTAAVSVTPGTTRSFRFSPAVPATSTVGTCTTVTVERLDDEGNLTNLPGALNAQVAATGVGSTGLVMASGTTCGTTATPNVTAAFAGSSARFSYDPRTVGNLVFTLSGAPTPGPAASTTVEAGALARLRFVSPPTTGQFGVCEQLRIEALDVGGNQVTSPTTVMLSASAAGTFWTGTTCTTGQTSSVTIPGSAFLNFGFLPQALNAVTLTGTSGGAMPAMAMLTISAGGEDSIQRMPGFIPMTTASPGNCTAFTLTRLDMGMNPAVGPARAVTVTLTGAASNTAPEAQLFDGAACAGTATLGSKVFTILANTSSIQFSVRVRRVGALTLAVTSGLTNNPADTSTTVVEGALASLTFAAPAPAQQLINTCSPAITVNGFDSFQNPTALGTLALSMPGASFLSAGCTNAIVNLAAGAASSGSFHVESATPGAATLTVGTTPNVTQMWNFVAPNPTKLRWKPSASPPTTLAQYTCSSAIQVQAVDASDVPTATMNPRPLSFAATSASMGFQFFSDSLCTVPVTGAFAIAGGQFDSPNLYVGSFSTGTFGLVATDTSGMPLTATPSASVMVTGAGTPTLAVTTASNDLAFRSCVAVAVSRESSGAPVTYGTTTVNVGVGGSPPSGSYTFHRMSDCSDPGSATVTGLTIASPAPNATIYVQGRSAEPGGSDGTQTGANLVTFTITATDQQSFFAVGTSATLSIHPLVRRGSCSSTDAAVSCLIQPPLPGTAAAARASSFFTYQATKREVDPTDPDEMTVRCALNAAATHLDCVRGSTSGFMEIRWQLVNMATGLEVAHVSGTASSTNNPIVVTYSLSSLASVNEAFVLYGANSSGGALDLNDQSTVELTNTTTATLRLPMGAGNFTVADYSLQIVKLARTSVTHGESTTAMASDTSIVAAPTAPPANTAQVLLESHRITGASSLCNLRLRGVVTSDTSLTFTRGAGSACATVAMERVVWERISIPSSMATIQTLSNIAVNGTSRSTSTSMTTVPLDRTWSVLSGQGLSGQAGGESASATSILPLSQGLLTYNAAGSQLIVSRSSDGANSTFSAFVVTFTQ